MERGETNEVFLQIENLFKHEICLDNVQLPLAKYEIPGNFSPSKRIIRSQCVTDKIALGHISAYAPADEISPMPSLTKKSINLKTFRIFITLFLQLFVGEDIILP